MMHEMLLREIQKDMEGPTFSDEASLVLRNAEKEALNMNQYYISTLHLLSALTSAQQTSFIFEDLKIDSTLIKNTGEKLGLETSEDPISEKQLRWAERTKEVMREAKLNAGLKRKYKIEPYDILVGITRTPNSLGAKILKKLRVNKKTLIEYNKKISKPLFT